MKDYPDSKIPRLFQLMEERKVKIKDITEATGITAASFTDWGRKGSIPSPKRLQQLADFFNVSVEYLLGTDSDSDAIDQKIQAELQQLNPKQKEDILKYIKFTAHYEVS